MRVAPVFVADPPWKFGDQLPGKGRGAGRHYATMTVDELSTMTMPWEAAKDAVLFLWRVSSMQQEALDVMGAWGFKLKTEIVWEKLTKNGKPWFGMGRIVRASHETCLIGVRGKPKVLVKNVRSRFSAKVPVGADGKYIHSAKPEEFAGIVESLYAGPYVELFARRYRAGWACFGDQLPYNEAA